MPAVENEHSGDQAQVHEQARVRDQGPETSDRLSTDEIRAALIAHKAELDGEVADLAEPVRAPGVQIQFGKRAGDHTADAVTQMQRSISAAELNQMSIEIDRAIAKLDDGTYGICDGCAEAIVSDRLEALPWATMCVACKSAGKVYDPETEASNQTNRPNQGSSERNRVKKAGSSNNASEAKKAKGAKETKEIKGPKARRA